MAPAERARWVRRYRESGLGMKRFAEEQGLRPTQLHYWIYGSRHSGRGSVVEEPVAEPVFREYVVPRGLVGDWNAEIALSDGTSLRLGRGADPAWVGALLDQLRRPCSH